MKPIENLDPEAARLVEQYDLNFILTLFDIAQGRIETGKGLNNLLDLHIAFMRGIQNLPKKPTIQNVN